MSLVAIIYLMSDPNPKYKMLAWTLVGWCGMQFAEALIWSQDAKNTLLNRLVTLIVIPLVLMMQPLGSLIGSFHDTPWKDSLPEKKTFTKLYSLLVVIVVLVWIFHNVQRYHTIKSDQHHLYWQISSNPVTNFNIIRFLIWGIMIIIPILKYWNGSYVEILIINSVGFAAFIYAINKFDIFGLMNDSASSIWCYYTSYSAILFSALKFFRVLDV